MAVAAHPRLEDRMTGHVVLRNISWRTYVSLLDEIGDGGTRLTYDRGTLEIEVPSRNHEQIKRLVGEMIVTCLKWSKVDYEPAGNATWQQEAALQGLEADECYHIQHAGAVRGKQELDLAVDPPPDLAVEVEPTSSAVDKLGIYASLKVPEVWRIRPTRQCEILLLGEKGYHSSSASVCMPLLTPEILSHYIHLREQIGHSATLRRFEAEILTT